jgi:hypothetical protein
MLESVAFYNAERVYTVLCEAPYCRRLGERPYPPSGVVGKAQPERFARALRIAKRCLTTGFSRAINERGRLDV